MTCVNINFGTISNVIVQTACVAKGLRTTNTFSCAPTDIALLGGLSLTTSLALLTLTLKLFVLVAGVICYFLTSIYVNVTFAAFPNASLFPACSHMILFWFHGLVLMQTIPRAPCTCAKVVFSHLLSFQQESSRTLLFYNPFLV